ncbi:serine hydrolase domain-containing protein [Mycobacterium riyadhense]|uniref:Penicillin-binding protein n=1 Tax=Mycobacterium riyadhense TaxID=486698 RepID=A0A1X2BNF0_9MYCO|nr:serine hydrolase domain-containing protein [Mycobacterium riyadhense]MCV7145708.1 beta-lactamase family protein [Mycobacterium riyadhense]ORW65132.1 penicillin-binding protein [Mycobacterium riyadhense]
MRHCRAAVTEFGCALGRLPHESAAAMVETAACTDLGVAFDELDAKINAGMKAYAIPGVAVAVWAGGQEYVKGYGVTNVDHPLPVDGDTIFRIGSTTKTFTGTATMRLVEQGKVDLDSPVRRYIPDFAVADESVSATVTVRQLLNHTAGWDGRNGQDFGRGDDAVARYVNSMTRLPQLTPPGTTFAYNNSGLVVAGRIIELVAGTTYESAIQKLVLDPLQLAHTRYFSDQIIGLNVAASHKVVDGKPIVDTDFWAFPRSCNPTGGLMSTARDQLRYARFHLGDGRAPNGQQILSRQSLEAMRSNPGAGGTLFVELIGMGVTWMLRPSAENVTVVEHGGTWKGQRSGFVMVPDRNFAMTVLTNSDGGFHMINDLFSCGWALHTFAGVSNLPATPVHLGAVELAPYEGRYIAEQVSQNGSLEQAVIDFRARDGQLAGSIGAGDANPDGENSAKLGFAFYRPDYGLDLGPDDKPTGSRSNFVRGPDGNIAWFCSQHGRLFRRQ